MGWKVKLAILVVVLLVLFNVINIKDITEKITPKDDKIKDSLSKATANVVSGVKKEVANASKEFVRDVTLKEDEVYINTDESVLEFVGYKTIGGSHNGTFDDWEGKVTLLDGEVVGIEITIDADSVNTGIDRLDNHLRNDDFFDVEKYPEIMFKSEKIEGGVVVGTLTFRGVEKKKTLDVEIVENEIKSEFDLDTSDYFNYVGVKDDVEIEIELVY